MNEALLVFIATKYAELNTILNDFVRVCTMEPSDERTKLLESIKDRTNHHGLHYTSQELSLIFLGGQSV